MAVRSAQFVPAPARHVSEEEAAEATRRFYDLMSSRRSIRAYSDRPVAFELVRLAIATAATAPSGANSQPWRFLVVSDPVTKQRLRVASEGNEHGFYSQRATPEWLDVLRPIGTDWHKSFLESAPYLIVVMEVLGTTEGRRSFYAKESVGIAVGLLLASLHHAGLGALTYTSSPFRWVNAVLGRPPNEHPFVIVPVGYPADDAVVPVLDRRPLEEVMEIYGPGR